MRRVHCGLLLLCCVLNTWPTVGHCQWTPPRIEIDTVVGDGWSQTILYFPNGTEQRTDLHRGAYLGYIHNRDHAPFLILAGYRCTECDAERMIVVYSPAEGPLRLRRAKTYSWPGDLTEQGLDSATVVSTSRFFFGACVSEGGDAIVQYVTHSGSGGEARTSVSVTQVLERRLVEREVPTLALTSVLARVRRGQCREVV